MSARKHRVDFALREMALVAVEPRAVQIRAGIGGRSGVLLRERLHHLGDALADHILKIARLENAQHAVGDVLRQFLFEPAFERGREIVGELIDLFGGGENFCVACAVPAVTAASSSAMRIMPSACGAASWPGGSDWRGTAAVVAGKAGAAAINARNASSACMISPSCGVLAAPGAGRARRAAAVCSIRKTLRGSGMRLPTGCTQP